MQFDLFQIRIDAERTFSMLTDIKTKKCKLNLIHVQVVCMFKLNLRTREKTAQTVEVDTWHLALTSSENLHQTNVTKDACFCVYLPIDVLLCP